MTRALPPTMDQERWQRAGQLFDQAVDLDPRARDALLDAGCIDDPELRELVEMMLVADKDPIEWLGEGAAALAGPVWETDGPEEGPAEGDTLDKYRLVREIGRGGMSRVFLAEQSDDRLQRSVAIKVMQATGRHRGDLERRFRAEGQVLATLSHPNIGRLFDAGVDRNGIPYLVMERVEGETITEYCRRAELSIDQRLELFLEVCSAVQHAHQRLVVHRDLKPSNILVDRDGRVKLLDFGIAKLLDPAHGGFGDGLTRTGLHPMTPEYAAPEQVRGEEITTATDTYALGILLYELLTGSRPYRLEGASLSEIERLICDEEPVKPSARVIAGEGPDRALEGGAGPRASPTKLRDQLRGDLDTIVLTALRKAPERRYPSAEALAADVRRYRSALPIEARPASATYRAGKFVRRHRLGVGVAALALLATIAFALAMARQHQETARQRDRAREAEKTATAVNRFLIDDLLGAVAPEVAQGREITVREVLDEASRNAERGLGDHPLTEATVRETLGEMYLRLGNAAAAAPHLDRSLQLFEDLGGRDHPASLRVRRLLATLRADRGDLDRSRALLQEVLREERLTLGPDHLETLRTATELGRVLHLQGFWSEGEREIRAAVRALDSVHPTAWRDRLRTLTLLTAILDEQRKSVQAERISAQVLAMQRLHLGPGHPDLADSMRVRANILVRLLRWEEAESLQREALELSHTVLGDHPRTYNAMRSLGRICFLRGRYAEAEEHFRGAAEGLERLLGEDHPDAMEAAASRGIALRYAGRVEEAEPIYRRTAELFERELGPGHPKTLRALKNLTDLLGVQGREEERREVVERILEIGRRVAADPDADPTFLSDIAEYSLQCRPESLRDVDFGLAVARTAVARSGGHHSEPLMTLAMALRAAGRIDEAIAVQRRAAALPDSLHLYAIDRTMLDLYREKEDPDGAESFLVERLASRRAHRPADDPLIGYSLRMLGRHLLDQGRLSEAEARLRESVTQYEKRHAPEDTPVLWSRAVLGRALAREGRLADAEEELLASYRGISVDRQLRNSVKREVLTWIVELYEDWGRQEEARRWRAELEARADVHSEYAAW